MGVESVLVLVLEIIIHHKPCLAAPYQDLATSNYGSHHLKEPSSQKGYDLNPFSGVLSSLKGNSPSTDSWHLRQGNSKQQSEFGVNRPLWPPSGMASFIQPPQMIVLMNSSDPQMDPRGNIRSGVKGKVGGTGDTSGMLGRLRVSDIKDPQTFLVPGGTLPAQSLSGSNPKEIVTGASHSFLHHGDGSLLPCLTISDGMPDAFPDILGQEVINNPLSNPRGIGICRQKFGQYVPREKQYEPRPNSYGSWGSFFNPEIYPYKSGLNLPNGPEENPYELGSTAYEPKTNAYDPGYIPHEPGTRPYGPGTNPFRPISNPYTYSEKPLNRLYIEIEPLLKFKKI